MSFDSLAYAIFLPLVIGSYWLLGRRQQNLLLLAASFVFYGWWDWRFLFLLWFTTAVDYFLSRAMNASQEQKVRKRCLGLSVGINLVVLGFFKYFGFFSDTLLHFLTQVGFHSNWTLLKIVLPIGVSFYTFESISYSVDVYNRRLVPPGAFTDYALFIAFFPHLVAGPIMRPTAFLPQCEKERRFRWKEFVFGLDLILWGLVKKLVVADGVSYYVDMIFGLSAPSSLLVIVGGIGFWIQILADFSAYTDIARGSARLLGFRLVRNFYAPYTSRSISEFWRRWHASLSSWIRDYLYIPLGGSRVAPARHIFNVLVTWSLCGLWHGAAWKYVAWGFFHGLLILSEHLAPPRKRPLVWAVISTNILVILGWIIFRAPSLDLLFSYFSFDALVLSLSDWKVAYAIMTIFLFYSLPWGLKIAWNRYQALTPLTQSDRRELRVVWYVTGVALIVLFGKIHSNAFIYFEF